MRPHTHTLSLSSASSAARTDPRSRPPAVQQNVEIPDIVLSIHPTIASAVAQASASGTRASVDLVDPSLLSDSAFLNKLQSEVNSWVKEIQTVTKLSRDVASGTASQEVNFWLGMERALEGIEKQLKSDPVQLTLDVLKHAKRFHATVSFIADTGLNDAFKTGASFARSLPLALEPRPPPRSWS